MPWFILMANIVPLPTHDGGLGYTMKKDDDHFHLFLLVLLFLLFLLLFFVILFFVCIFCHCNFYKYDFVKNIKDNKTTHILIPTIIRLCNMVRQFA